MSRLTIAHEMGLPGWVERLPFCQSFLVRIVHPLPLDLQNCPLLEQEQQALHLFHADWMVQDCPCACVESFLWALPCSLVGGGRFIMEIASLFFTRFHRYSIFLALRVKGTSMSDIITSWKFKAHSPYPKPRIRVKSRHWEVYHTST